jgi:hypothetical protein
MAWLVSAKEIRFFTVLRVYFSIYVRGFLGVKESQVSYGRIHKKTPSSNPWQEFLHPPILTPTKELSTSVGVISL